MRILFAVSSLSAGGAERMISELANAFAARGHEVGVLTLSHPHSDHYTLDPNVERIALDVIWDSTTAWESVRSNLVRSQMIRRAVARFKPQVVVSFSEQTNVRVLAALLGTGMPVIVSERTDPRRYAVGQGWVRARRVLYPTASRLVVQTDAVAKWAATVVSVKKVRVIPNFVRGLPEPVLEGRDPVQVLAVGRLDRHKGFDLLLQAFAKADLARRGVRLTILGEGQERASLQSLAEVLGISGAVEMPGVVKNPETWMARCTLFVMPSRFEGFPNALLEAMAMGCPVIAADCDSGPREIITHETDGLLVPQGDEAALADALVRVFEQDDLRGRLAGRAVAVRDRFSRHSIVSRWEALINEVIEEKRK